MVQSLPQLDEFHIETGPDKLETVTSSSEEAAKGIASAIQIDTDFMQAVKPC